MRFAVLFVAVAATACFPTLPPDAGLSDDAGDPPDEDAGDAPPADGGAVVDGGTTADGGREHGLPARVPNTTCALVGSPPNTIPSLLPQSLAPASSLTGARSLAPFPGRDEVIAATAAETIVARSAAPGGAASRTVLDLATKARADGVLAAVVRGDGAELYASYVTPDPARVVVARYDLDATGTASLASEVVLVNEAIVDPTRAGGGLAITRGARLIVALGDGGTASAAQDALSRLGKALQIDVRDGMPSTAVVVNSGLGDPWSCGVDPVVGRVWCADRGGDSVDEIVTIDGAANHGWPHMEGATCRDASPKCTDDSLTPPVHEATRGGAECGLIVAGAARLPSLGEAMGVVVFGDACTTQLEGLRFDGRFAATTGSIVNVVGGLAAIGVAEDGEVVVVDDDGAVHALARSGSATAPTFPATITQTGCFDDVPLRVPAASLVPYDVRSPLWSDGTEKRRWIVLPGTSTIGFVETGPWTFPVGTILVKEFALSDGTPLETRFFVVGDTSWTGVTYVWNEAATEAYLLEGGEVITYDVGATRRAHVFPSRVDCLLCHNSGAGRGLGFRTGRMNLDYDYDGFVENQLAAMDFIGLFSPALPTVPDQLPRWADHRDAAAPIEDRARGYLAGNCAHCHQPSGPAPFFDARYETPFSSTNTCNRLVIPGDPAASPIFARMSTRGAGQMPPIATRYVDDAGQAVVEEWIDGLAACP